MSPVPQKSLNSGHKMPMIGLGTWELKDKDVKPSLKAAIDAGYRAIDCAHVYGNEKEIGETLAEIFKEGKVKREDLFITSKLWSAQHKQASVKPACELTLKNLRLDYVDLYLMHFPYAFKEGEGDFPKPGPDESHHELAMSDTDYLEAWKGMEECVKAGLVKSIGVCNFNTKQIKRLLENCSTKPAMVQVELHPFLPQKKLVDYCNENGIAVTAYSSLGNPGQAGDKFNLLDEPRVKKIAEKHKKTTGQVLLRFSLERDICVIPKSVNPERVKSNYQITDFKLDKEDMDTLLNFKESHRVVDNKWASDHKYFPFGEE